MRPEPLNGGESLRRVVSQYEAKREARRDSRGLLTNFILDVPPGVLGVGAFLGIRAVQKRRKRR